ncbi:MAG: redoxin domain-containing protein [Bacteroidales bacterium]
MNMYSTIFKLLILMMIFASCGQQQDAGKIKVSGTVGDGAGSKIVVAEMAVNGVMALDSLFLDEKGSFDFTIRNTETSFYLLMRGINQRLPLVAAPGDNLIITTDSSDFSFHWEISGNPDAVILKDYFGYLSKNEKVLDSLSKVFIGIQDADNFYEQKMRLDQILDSLIADQKKFTREFLENHPGSFAALLILNQRFGGEKMIDAETDYELMTMIDDLLYKKYPENSHVNLFHERMELLSEMHREQQEAEERLSPGKTAPAISLQNVQNQKTSLSDLIGRKVLIFFWASYSPESRADLQQLKNLLGKQQALEFAIYAVSLDHNRKFWETALEVENTPWINVIDTRGLHSPVVKLYNVPEQLPYYYLIDEEGRIMMKSGDFSDIEIALTD